MNDTTLFVVPQADDIVPGFPHTSHDMYVDPYGSGVFHSPSRDHVDHARKVVHIEHRPNGAGSTGRDVIVLANLEQGDILVKRGTFTGIGVDIAVHIDDVSFHDIGHYFHTHAREQYCRNAPHHFRKAELSSLGTLDADVYYIVERDSDEYKRLKKLFDLNGWSEK